MGCGRQAREGEQTRRTQEGAEECDPACGDAVYFDGNSIRVAKNYKGGPTSPASGGLDALIYITSGKMKFYQDGKEAEVAPATQSRDRRRGNTIGTAGDSSFVATQFAGCRRETGPGTDR